MESKKIWIKDIKTILMKIFKYNLILIMMKKMIILKKIILLLEKLIYALLLENLYQGICMEKAMKV